MSFSLAQKIEQYCTYARFQWLAPKIRLKGITYRCHPTLYGLVFFGMLVALLIGSINHNNNLGYLLTFLLSSMYLISILMTFRNLLGIEINGQNGIPVFVGQSATFLLVIRANSNLRYGIALSLDHLHQRITDLQADQQTAIDLSLPTAKRGRLHIAQVFLSTSFPLGLFKVHTQNGLKLSCLVYPRPVPTPLDAAKNPGEQEQHNQKYLSGGRDFTGLTPYIPGDSPKQIHWKSLASGKGLYSKRFEEQTAADLILSLQEIRGTDLEDRLSKLCFLILQAKNRTTSFGLRLNDQYIPPSRGQSHVSACLKALCLYGETSHE